MDKYEITGMSCAACQARVEKAVSEVPGVDSCSVSLLTNSMGVAGTASRTEIIKAVEDAGYGAFYMPEDAGDAGALYKAEREALEDKETPKLKKRLILSAALLIVLMYFSMGHAMLGLPLPPGLSGNHLASGVIQMILSAAVLFINRRFFISGVRSVLHGAPNMDTLVAMGAGVSFLWSAYLLAGMAAGAMDGSQQMEGMHGLYFESAAMIVTLITVGKLLESVSKGRTTDALKGLMELAPERAILYEDGTERIVGIEEVKPGDIFCVRPGERIPCDGEIVYGAASVDESALTGESIPVDKKEGDTVSCATTDRSGYIRARAVNVGRDTTLAKVIDVMRDAANTKAPLAKTADRVSAVFVPFVIAAAAATCAVWLLLGAEPGFAVARAITVLVVSCPCALGLATPVAIMVGSGVGARHGILFKTAESLETAGRVRTAVLDKTGTVTRGEPEVTELAPASGTSERELAEAAYSIESRSEHPLSRAVVRYARANGFEKREVEDFREEAGRGVSGSDAEALRGGKPAFIEETADVPEEEKEKARAEEREGRTCLFFSRGGKYLGFIAVSDVLRDDSASSVEELKKMGVEPVMLTGDNEATAKEIARQAGIGTVIAGVLPDGKAKAIGSVSDGGKVMMVGDGINDAPALVKADCGVAVGAGTDIAIDAADIVLMTDGLTGLVDTVRLSRAVIRNIYENLFWAFIYNILLIPLAAGVYTGLFGWTMDPMWGAAAMSLSSFTVVMNALRLNRVKLSGGKKETRKAGSGKEEQAMEKKILIEGMMCEHCEMTVEKALCGLDGVEQAHADHEKNEAVVSLSKELPDDALRKAVEDKDYKVTDVI